MVYRNAGGFVAAAPIPASAARAERDAVLQAVNAETGRGRQDWLVTRS